MAKECPTAIWLRIVCVRQSIYYRDYVNGIGNGYISRDIPLNTCPQYVDMGMGQRAQKMSQNSPKIMKMVKTGSCYSVVFSFTIKLDDNSTAHAKLQALYLPFVLKNGMESRHRRQERFDVSTRLVSLFPSCLALYSSSKRYSNTLKVPMQYTNQVHIV